jgi:4'-phosphopantetheinyl transferase EntD
MIIWKFIDDKDGHTFNLPYPDDQAQTAIRKGHFQNSRLALSECLKGHGLQVEDIEDLTIRDHHCLKKDNQLLASLAHTRGAACAIVATQSFELHGIGIDCERQDRIIRHEILDKFSGELDDAETNLHLWCAKEAAFKASSYFWKLEKTFILKDIIIKKDIFEIPGLLAGRLEHENVSDYLVTRAMVTQLFL